MCGAGVRVQSKLPKDRKGLRPGTFTLFFTELNQSSVKAQSKLNQSPSLLPFQSVQPRLSSTSLPVVCRHASLLPASQWCAAKPLFYQPPSGVGLNEAATATDLPIHRSTDDLCAAGRVRGCWRVERGRNGRPIYAAGRVCIVSSRLVVSLGNSSRFSISSLARWSSEMPPPLFKQRGTFAPPGAWNMLEGYLSRFTLSSSVLKVTCSVLKVTCSVL